jgi:hypothetical protein
MLDSKFEKFRGGPAPKFGRSDAPRVTLSPRGVLYFNRSFINDLGKPQAFTLHYAEKDEEIALCPTHERDPDGFPVVRKQSGWAVHMSTFMRHHRIKIPITQRFINPFLDSDKTLYLALRQTNTVGGIKRKRRDARGVAM